MDPHHGPVSAYQAARVELENAEVDYNYCLYYPCNEVFRPPPAALGRQQKSNTATKERTRLWNVTKKCMREDTLQALKDGALTGNGTESQGGMPLRKHSREVPVPTHVQTLSSMYPTFPGNFNAQQTQAFGQSILH